MIPKIEKYKSAETISPQTLSYLKENKVWYPKGIKTHLLFMSVQGFAAEAGVATVHNPGFKDCIATYEDKYMRWSYDPRDFKKISDAIIIEIDKDPNWQKEYTKMFWNTTDKLVDKCGVIFWGDHINDKNKLAKAFLDLVNMAVEPQAYGYITEIFTFTNDYWITKRLKELAPSLSDDDIKALTFPVTKSFVQVFQDTLLKAKDDSDLTKVLNKFYWVKGSYFTQPELTIEALWEEKKALSVKDDLSEVVGKKKEILDKLNNQKLNNFVAFIEDFISMQDERKANVLRTNYALLKLARDVHILTPDWPEEVLLDLMPREFIDVLSGKVSAKFQNEIKERNTKSIWLFECDKYCITTSPPLVKEIFELLEEKKTLEIKGYVASKGKATGVVKVVLSEQDFDKVNVGDILVTSMTRPEFMPVLQKASAFVTNEGGITCHAAIVSREMKKPCIIGTKNATKVLKDGDMVEVDADKGVVKVIKIN